MQDLGYLSVNKDRIAVKLPGGRTFGDVAHADVVITMKTSGSVYRALVFGYVGLMEEYFRGAIDIGGSSEDSLSALIGLSYEDPVPSRNPFVILRQWLHEWRTDNASFQRAKENAEAHHDLPAEFFRLFLGDTYGYTEGYFHTGNESQDEAQRAKFDLISKKLLLEPGMKVNEVGSGWGYGAVHVAKHNDVDITNYGLVNEQNRVMREMIKQEGLDDKVRVVQKDYRDLGQEKEVYDRHYSIGVMEHAGFRCHEAWVRAIAHALKPGGLV